MAPRRSIVVQPAGRLDRGNRRHVRMATGNVTARRRRAKSALGGWPSRGESKDRHDGPGIYMFGDTLEIPRYDVPGNPEPRYFATIAEAEQFMRTQEFRDIERMITSLKIPAATA